MLKGKEIHLDNRVKVHHIALYTAILSLSLGNPMISSSRRKLMLLSHITNLMTYHKCIRQLEEFGYIKYCPSYHPKNGSLIRIQ